MPSITFINAEGDESVVDAKSGMSVMRAAIENDIDGIEAECGGGCMCATCHVFVDIDWIDRLTPALPEENDMLDETSTERADESRLSCQIMITDEMDGLIVRLPATQV